MIVSMQVVSNKIISKLQGYVFFQISDFGLSQWEHQLGRIRGTKGFIPTEYTDNVRKKPNKSFDIYR